MTFTPYTKDAITRIKNGATAAELGWSDLFYLRICKEHGLSPNVWKPKSHVLSEIEGDATPPLAPEVAAK